MLKKVILEGSASRKKLLKGALTVSRILGSTLGPRGRNVVIQQAYSAPQIVNDGGIIARKIVLNDPTEDLGAQTIVEATMKTNDRGGDGRTTTAVIAGKIIEKVGKKIEDHDEAASISGEPLADVIGMSRDILKASDEVVEKLKKAGKKLKKGELKNVIATSIGKIYPEYIEPIAEMVEKVGTDGYISVEDNYGTKYGVETNLIEGMRFLGSYASPAMITNPGQKESVWEDAHVLVTNFRIETGDVIANLLKEFRETGKRKIVIIAEGYEIQCLSQIVSLYIRAAERLSKGESTDHLKILLVKAPSLTTDQFEDVATFCGARFFDKNKGGDLSRATFKDLGHAKKFAVDENDTHINGGIGDVAARLKILNEELENEKDSAFKEQLKRRIGALTSGFGIIRVGASTETERVYLKKKIIDSVNAGKAALEEGVIRGGGIALKDIAEELGADHILYEALLEPNKKIVFSLDGSKIPDTVVDPLKVTRLAVENACSVAAHLITCEGSIADSRRTFMDELQQAVTPKDNEDFRDDENQELKYRT